jgi:myosin-5
LSEAHSRGTRPTATVDSARADAQGTIGDIEILFDVCWILSPTQIQKLISQYHNADYEAPIPSEILKTVAARVKPDDKTDQLLLAPETDDVGPYQLPQPRDIAGLETCESGRRSEGWMWMRCGKRVGADRQTCRLG